MRVNSISSVGYPTCKRVTYTKHLSNNHVAPVRPNFKGKTGQITGSIFGALAVLLISCFTVPALACLVAPAAALCMIGGDAAEDVIVKFKQKK